MNTNKYLIDDKILTEMENKLLHINAESEALLQQMRLIRKNSKVREAEVHKEPAPLSIDLDNKDLVEDFGIPHPTGGSKNDRTIRMAEESNGPSIQSVERSDSVRDDWIRKKYTGTQTDPGSSGGKVLSRGSYDRLAKAVEESSD